MLRIHFNSQYGKLSVMAIDKGEHAALASLAARVMEGSASGYEWWTTTPAPHNGETLAVEYDNESCPKLKVWTKRHSAAQNKSLADLAAVIIEGAARGHDWHCAAPDAADFLAADHFAMPEVDGEPYDVLEAHLREVEATPLAASRHQTALPTVSEQE